MKRGLTVRMPIPALFTSMSMPPSRDHAWPTARATDDSARTSISTPAAPGSPAATSAARAADRPVTATLAPAAARAEAIARPRPLVPPVTSTLRAETPMTPRLGVRACPKSSRGRYPGLPAVAPSGPGHRRSHPPHRAMAVDDRLVQICSRRAGDPHGLHGRFSLAQLRSRSWSVVLMSAARWLLGSQRPGHGRWRSVTGTTTMRSGWPGKLLGEARCLSAVRQARRPDRLPGPAAAAALDVRRAGRSGRCAVACQHSLIMPRTVHVIMTAARSRCRCVPAARSALGDR